MTILNINLLPEELRPRAARSMGELPGRDIVLPLVIGLAVAAALFALPMLIEQLYLAPRDQAAQDADDQLTQEINKYNTTLKSLEGLSSEKDELRQQLVTLQGVAQAGVSWGSMLNELRAMTPGDLWFDKLDTDSTSGGLKVAGAALDYNAVAYFHNNLQHSLYFQNPSLSKTEKESGTGSGPKLVKFEMGFALKPPSPPPEMP